MLLLCSAGAHATTLQYEDLDSLSAHADGVIVGTVANIESMYGPDKNIYTVVTLKEVDPLKGDTAGSSLELRFLGGTVEHDVLEVEGAPHFAQNERLILFVRGNGREMVPLVGWNQGVFRVGKDPKNGREIVFDHEGNRVLGVSGKTVIREQRIRPEARIVGDGRDDVKSPAAEAAAGRADHGSTAISRNQAPPAASESFDLPQFVEIVKQRIATAALDSSTPARRLENAGKFETLNPNDEQPEGASEEPAVDSQPQGSDPVPPRRILPTPLPSGADRIQ
jgi:hypothetical protein